MENNKTILEVQGLKKYFPLNKDLLGKPSAYLRAVDDVTFSLEKGKTIEFVTAPGTWGDGYIYPIVEITIDGETLLEFEEGFPNFLEYFKKNKNNW